MMNKKHIRTIVALTATAVALTGCTRFEEDDFFDESASLRIEHTATDLQELLTSAPQGWVMQYHTGTGVSVFEGFNLFAKFEKSGKVTIAGNHKYLRDGNANKYTEAVSLYQLIREEGLVLAFNTWNDVLTPFVDPVAFYAAPQRLEKDGAGMEGDQNLVVVSYNDNEVILRGERHGAEVRLVKADRSWQDYIADTETMKKSITNTTITSYYLTAGGKDTLYYVGLRGGKYRKSDRVADPLRVDSLSCCFTPYGFRNEHSDEIGGHRFQEFTLAEDKSRLLNEDGTVEVIPTWDTYILKFDSDWMIDLENLPTEQQTLIAEIEEELKKAMSNVDLIEITGIGLGKSDDINGMLVKWQYKKGRKTEKYAGRLEMNINRGKFGEMSVQYTTDGAIDNNIAILNSPAMGANDAEGKIRALAESLNGTYRMTPDDYFDPKTVTFSLIGQEGISFQASR